MGKMKKSDIPEEQRLAINRGKTGDRSPMLGRYSVGIDKARLIEAEHVVVYWDKGPDYKSVSNLCVAYCPREVMTEKDFDIWWAWDTFDCVMGNCCTGWPAGKHSSGETDDYGNCPTGLFGHLLNSGFTDKEEMTRALREFARIKECHWARRMLWMP